MLAVRWLIRTIVPTIVLTYLSSKATLSPQRKSSRLGSGAVGSIAGSWYAGAAPGGGGSIAAYGNFHSRLVAGSCSTTCVSRIWTTSPSRIWPSRQSRNRTVCPRWFARTAMIRFGSASMRSMIACSWNSSRLLARLRASRRPGPASLGVSVVLHRGHILACSPQAGNAVLRPRLLSRDTVESCRGKRRSQPNVAECCSIATERALSRRNVLLR